MVNESRDSSRSRISLRIVGVGAVVVAIAAASVAVASGVAPHSIPDSHGVYHGCFAKATGALRVIDPGAGKTCASSEASATWNKAGPQGPPGRAGARGPSDVFEKYGDTSLHNFARTGVVSLSLPAGNYFVTAHVQVVNAAVDAQSYECELDVNYDSGYDNPIDKTLFGSQLGAGGDAGSTLELPLQGTVLYTTGGYAQVSCNTSDGAAGATLDAIEVATLHR